MKLFVGRIFLHHLASSKAFSSCPHEFRVRQAARVRSRSKVKQIQLKLGLA